MRNLLGSRRKPVSEQPLVAFAAMVMIGDVRVAGRTSRGTALCGAASGPGRRAENPSKKALRLFLRGLHLGDCAVYELHDDGAFADA